MSLKCTRGWYKSTSQRQFGAARFAEIAYTMCDKPSAIGAAVAGVVRNRFAWELLSFRCELSIWCHISVDDPLGPAPEQG
jgi:hypothetical protein